MLLNSASVQIVGIRELPVSNDTDYFLLGYRVMHGHLQAKDVDIGVLEVQVDRATGSMDSIHKPCTSINLLVWSECTHCLCSAEDSSATVTGMDVHA